MSQECFSRRDAINSTALAAAGLTILALPDAAAAATGMAPAGEETSTTTTLPAPTTTIASAIGTVDDGFRSTVNGYVYSIAQSTDGKFVIGGTFTGFVGATRNRIARLNTDGTLDNDFDPGTGANDSVYTIVVQSDGKFLVGGFFTTVDGVTHNRIARLNTDGTLDNDFNAGTGANGPVRRIALQSDGKILVGGSFTTFDGVTHNRIARLNTDGTLDNDFNAGTGVNNSVYSTAVQSGGKILVGGGFTAINGVTRNNIARLNTDGTLDNDFNAGTGGRVNAIVVQSDGKILVGGIFTTINGVTHNRIARLNTDGTLDNDFNTGTGASGSVEAIALQSDGKILVGGSFTSIDGVTRNRIARLNTDGTLDNDFNPNANASVYSIVLQAGGNILIGGGFSTVSGITRNQIARLA